MNKHAKSIGLGLALALALASLPAMAAEGRIPIWQPTTIGPGAEGKYILTRDITGAAGAAAIDILGGTVAVDIDLNGFTIYGVNPNSVIQARGVDSLTVRNGTIMFGGGGGGQAGIYVEDSRKVVVEDVKIQFVAGFGVALNEVQNFAVRRNIVVGCSQDGIIVDGFFIDPTAVSDGVIEGNIIRECGGGIGLLNCASTAVTENRIEESTMAGGIFVDSCDGCMLIDNAVTNMPSIGIDLNNFYRGKIYNNVVTKTTNGEGIYVHLGADDNLILNNVVSGAGFIGLRVDSDRNHIEGNVMNSNGSAVPGNGWGLAIYGWNNTYRGNTAHNNNGGGATCTTGPATTDFCDDTGGNRSPFNQPPTLAGDNLMPFAL